MNKVVLIGRFTKEIELRKLTNNKSVSNFTVAVQRNFKNSEGKYESDFIQCIAYGSVADFIEKYFEKGDEVALSGRIQARHFTAQDGTNKYVTEIIVESAEFTHGKPKQDTGKNDITNEVPGNYTSEYEERPEFALTDDDLPF